MSMSLNIHAQHQGLVITQEHPENAGSMTISESGGGFALHLYLPLHQWHALRNALPKAESWMIYCEQEKRWLYGLEGELFAKAHFIRMTMPIPGDEAEEAA